MTRREDDNNNIIIITTSCEQMTEEDYIDMDISSTTFLCYNITSSSTSPPRNTRDFEFHLFPKPQGKEDSIASPADELFYKGKLLPLHLPPRLQMVEKLLNNSITSPVFTTSASLDDRKESDEGNENSKTTQNSTYATPLESCNISPSSSCYVSGELNPEELFYSQYSAGVKIPNTTKKSWSKKLKESSLGMKLKASSAYLKSLFTKSGCSDESSGFSKAKNSSSKGGKRNPFLQIRRERRCSDVERKVEEDSAKRTSFSGFINHHQTTKTSSFSSSSSSYSSSTSSSFSSTTSSNDQSGPAILKRSSSARSEVENPIQGAIAYCKKTQQLITGRKSHSDVGYCSLSAATNSTACDDKEGPEFAGDKNGYMCLSVVDCQQREKKQTVN